MSFTDSISIRDVITLVFFFIGGYKMCELFCAAVEKLWLLRGKKS